MNRLLFRGILAAPLAGALALAITACSSSGDAPMDNACSSSSGEALSVCAKGPTVNGVDVSTYQGTVNWASVKSSGRVFAFTRVSDGTTHPDGTFATNWAGIKNAGLLRGAYQFFRPGEDPNAQADLLIAKVGKLGAGDLPAVLDLETVDGVAAATLQARAKAWLQRVEQGTGKKPIVYTANFMSSAIGTSLGAYPLWVANYGVTCPTMPSGFTAWKFWQSSSTGNVSGISGAVDLDEFQGTLADLKTYADGAPSDGGPPPAHDGGVPEVDAGSGTGDGNAMGDGIRLTAGLTLGGAPCN